MSLLTKANSIPLHRVYSFILYLPELETPPQKKTYYGLIHDDVIRANAQVTNDGPVAILDFDLYGPGWRAYDIASYLAVIRGESGEAALAVAFLHRGL